MTNRELSKSIEKNSGVLKRPRSTKSMRWMRFGNPRFAWEGKQTGFTDATQRQPRVSPELGGDFGGEPSILQLISLNPLKNSLGLVRLKTTQEFQVVPRYCRPPLAFFYAPLTLGADFR
jgi:hypothetical protein